MNCKFCGMAIREDATYCSVAHQNAYQRKLRFDEFERLGYFPKYNGGHTNHLIRPYLRDKRGWKCEICGLSEWRGKEIPLIADHIDGDPYNDAISNFRLVCPNCDAQLPTFKSKNRGKGRSWRRDLYAAEKVKKANLPV